jgi:hypothetical protein
MVRSLRRALALGAVFGALILALASASAFAQSGRGTSGSGSRSGRHGTGSAATSGRGAGSLSRTGFNVWEIGLIGVFMLGGSLVLVRRARHEL